VAALGLKLSDLFFEPGVRREPEPRVVRDAQKQLTGLRSRLTPRERECEYLDDPREVPYLLLWKSPWDGEIKEAVRLARYVDPHDPHAARSRRQ
jgi:hypothetical protein